MGTYTGLIVELNRDEGDGGGLRMNLLGHDEGDATNHDRNRCWTGVEGFGLRPWAARAVRAMAALCGHCRHRLTGLERQAGGMSMRT